MFDLGFNGDFQDPHAGKVRILAIDATAVGGVFLVFIVRKTRFSSIFDLKECERWARGTRFEGVFFPSFLFFGDFWIFSLICDSVIL
jgi:hypothetical protein